MHLAYMNNDNFSSTFVTETERYCREELCFPRGLIGGFLGISMTPKSYLLRLNPQHCAFINGSAYSTFLRVRI